MKELKTYAHLYLGCEVRNYYGNETYDEGVLVGISASEVEPNKTIAIFSNGGTVFQECYIEDAKLILRPLSDMKIKDACDIVDSHGSLVVQDCYSFVKNWIDDKATLLHFDTIIVLINKMRSMGFDVDGLIDSGLAVSKTETK